MALVRFTAAALALLAATASAKIHHLTIKNDPRYAFSIESFGFLEGGTVSIRVHDVAASPPNAHHMMGFVLYPTSTESRIAEQIDTLITKRQCALDAENEGIYIINASDPASWKREAPLEVTIDRPGLYDLLFTHCEPAGGQTSFTAEIVFINPDGHYLAAGELPLPAMYGAVCAAFVLALAAWLRYTRSHKADMHKLHHLMTLLVTLKVTSSLCQALMFHFIDTTGHSTGWSVAFYIATFFRGLLTIAVIALIGAGWSLLKPFLNDREKKVLMIALPLQVLNNIAIIVTDEMAPGSMGYVAWYDILKVADFVAVLVVLLPIIFSINSLKAVAADGGDEKARSTLARLVQFRSFYIVIVGYLYVSRVLVFVLAETLPYTRTWVAPFFEEAATLAFYVYAGWRFRPAPDNSDYFSVPADEDGPDGPAEGGTAIDGAGSGSGPAGSEDDVAISLSTGSSTRAVSANQTVARTKLAPLEATGGEGGSKSAGAGVGAAAVLAPAAAASAAGAAAVAIADDDEADEFGLDGDDDDEELDRITAAAAGRR